MDSIGCTGFEDAEEAHPILEYPVPLSQMMGASRAMTVNVKPMWSSQPRRSTNIVVSIMSLFGNAINA
jgi:hypothetical protein